MRRLVVISCYIHPAICQHFFVAPILGNFELWPLHFPAQTDSSERRDFSQTAPHNSTHTACPGLTQVASVKSLGACNKTLFWYCPCCFLGTASISSTIYTSELYCLHPVMIFCRKTARFAMSSRGGGGEEGGGSGGVVVDCAGVVCVFARFFCPYTPGVWRW